MFERWHGGADVNWKQKFTSLPRYVKIITAPQCHLLTILQEKKNEQNMTKKTVYVGGFKKFGRPLNYLFSVHKYKFIQK